MTKMGRETAIDRRRLRRRLSVAGNFAPKSRDADPVRLEPGEKIGWLPEDCRALDAA